MPSEFSDCSYLWGSSLALPKMRRLEAVNFSVLLGLDLYKHQAQAPKTRSEVNGTVQLEGTYKSNQDQLSYHIRPNQKLKYITKGNPSSIWICFSKFLYPSQISVLGQIYVPMYPESKQML